MADVLVWGAGGHGRVIADVAARLGHHVVGYADAERDRIGSMVDRAGRKVVMHEDSIASWLHESDHRILALGVGDNAARLSIRGRFPPERMPGLIHPAAVVSTDTRIGPATVIMAAAVVNTSTDLGEAVIINTGAIVEHDNWIGSGVHVSPGAVLGGSVHVEDGAWIGANATVLPGVRIGAGAVIGAGSVVLEEVQAGSTVVGIPARRIR